MDNIAGKAYTVVDNTTCHGFTIGDTVVSMDEDSWEYKSVTTRKSWLCHLEDLEPFNITRED